jgi:hypothetical protein
MIFVLLELHRNRAMVAGEKITKALKILKIARSWRLWFWRTTVVEDVRFPVIIFTPEYKGFKSRQKITAISL